MVGVESIIMMVISIFLSVVFPVVLLIIMIKKYKASLKSCIVGALSFIVAVQLLEAPVHRYFLSYNIEISSFIMGNPVVYMLYGGFMAGIFEETARYICFKFLLKKQNKVADGISYGIGNGGIEAILIVGLVCISNLVVSIMINMGIVTSENIGNIIYTQLTQVPSYMFGISGLERFCTIIIQIGLSLIVFKAVKERKKFLYIMAIIIHAIIDFPVALAQMGILNIFIVEGILIGISILFLLFILKELKDNKTSEIN